MRLGNSPCTVDRLHPGGLHDFNRLKIFVKYMLNERVALVLLKELRINIVDDDGRQIRIAQGSSLHYRVSRVLALQESPFGGKKDGPVPPESRTQHRHQGPITGFISGSRISSTSDSSPGNGKVHAVHSKVPALRIVFNESMQFKWAFRDRTSKELLLQQRCCGWHGHQSLRQNQSQMKGPYGNESAVAASGHGNF
eukprot:scaffold6155_cov108-Cylindrotheca_fusiformis.AAC.2